jgi:hypothetical protein
MPYFNPSDVMPTKIGQVIGDVISALIFLSVAALMAYAALNGLGWW